MDNNAEKQKIVAGLLGAKLIAYNADLAKILGDDIPASIFLNQLLYWWGKGEYPDKVWKTDKEFYDECGITEEQCKRIRNKLKNLGIITIKKEGLPARNFYYINFDALYELIQNKLELKPLTSQGKSHSLVRVKDTDITKNTTENTTDSSSSNLQLDNDSINSLSSPDITDYEFLEKIWFYTTGRKNLTYYERMTLETLLKNYGREKLKYALEEAARHNRRELAYIAGILMNNGKKAKKSIWD